MTNGICWNSVSSCRPNTSDPIRSTKIPKTRAYITCGIHTHTEPPIPRQAHFPHCGRNHQLLLGELDDRYSGLLHSSSLNPHVVCAVPKSDPGLRLALKVFSCALAVEFGPTRVFIDTCTVSPSDQKPTPRRLSTQARASRTANPKKSKNVPATYGQLP